MTKSRWLHKDGLLEYLNERSTPKGFVGSGTGSHIVWGIFEALHKRIEHLFLSRWTYPFPKPANDDDAVEDWESSRFGSITFTLATNITIRTGRKRAYTFDVLMRPTLSRGQFDSDDEKALNSILALARAGKLHNVTRCSQCRKWIFARTKRNTFCSDTCREKNFRSTPAGREARRLYMRRYRAQPDYQRTKLQAIKKSKRKEPKK